jgi:putative ABC transport system substrate-binding protein
LQRSQDALSATDFAAFAEGLRQTGYAEGREEMLAALAADLVRQGVAVIVAGARAAAPAKSATQSIPIVFFQGSDPVRLGLVASLNRPGGNLTGFTMLGADIATKRLGLLHDLVPQTSVIGVLRESVNLPENLIEAAPRIGLSLKVVKAPATTAPETEWSDAFASLAKERVGAIFVPASANFAFNARDLLVSLAARYNIPAIYNEREFVDAGGLASYGASIPDIFRKMGLYTGRILKGDKPADLPVLLPSKFDFTINFKTAKALNLHIPPGVLAIADAIIE